MFIFDPKEAELMFETEEVIIDTQYEYWKEKRQKDVSWCMKAIVTETPENGKVRYSFKPCGEPDCPTCGPQIRKKMKEDIGRVLLQKKELRILTLTGTIEEQKKQRARIMRIYGKEKCAVYVSDLLTPKGLELETEILIDTKDEIGKVYNEIRDDDIYKWSQKSFQSKKSGTLFQSTKPIPAGEVIEQTQGNVTQVEVEQWQTDTKDQKKLEEIEEEVQEKTNYLNPVTVEELEEALAIRRQVRANLYRDNDVVILSNKSIKVTIKITDINWQK